MFEDKDQQYSKVAKFFHWAIALLILGLVLVGLYMTGLPYSPEKFEIYGWHKSFGLVVLWLAGLRIIWRLIKKPPQADPDHAAWERILAKAAHLFLYVVMIGMPVSGWLMSSAGGYQVPFFGFQMPDLMGKDLEMAALFNKVHEILGYGLIIAIGLHAAGALKHHIIDGDGTLKKMLPRIASDIMPYILIILLGGFFIGVYKLAAPNFFSKFFKPSEETQEISSEVQDIETPDVAAQSDQWDIVSDQSQIQFKIKLYGKDVDVRFASFSGNITFNPNDLENSKAQIFIKTNSVTSGDQDRDIQIMGGEWFDINNYPLAVFETLMFENIDGNEYLVIGNLKIKDRSVPVRMPFTLDIVTDDSGETRAFMRGNAELNRMDFGLGTGEWETSNIVGFEVAVDVQVVATSR